MNNVNSNDPIAAPVHTLRLLMPQWQGGNNPAYPLGARLLAWLAPHSDQPLVEVPIRAYDKASIKKEDGVIERSALKEQLKAARQIVNAYTPERIVVFGGDCLISQAPFSYLNERYGGELGVLWIDAHPDVTTPKEFSHEHAMVLGNLLGEGDPDFAREVALPLKPKNVMFAGLQVISEQETEVIGRLGLRRAGPKELIENSEPVLAWIKEEGVKHLAIHLDLDVLDPKLFRSLLFANPDPDSDTFEGVSQGEMTLPQLTRLITDVSKKAEVVGLAIAEHLPWDAINLKNMLDAFPILNDSSTDR